MKKKIVIISWLFYDFANTFFTMNIVSLYFVLWVTVTKQAKDFFYAIALSISALLVAVCTPVFGVLSDRSHKRMSYLLWFTLLCVIFTAFLGKINGLYLGLGIFIFANLFYQLANVFYNALLPQISRPATLGRISGLGIACNYLGTIASLSLVKPYVTRGTYQDAFLPTAFFFLLFSLPCFLFVKDKYIHAQSPIFGSKFSEIFQRYKKTWQDMRQDKNLFNFMLSTFIALNAVSTVIIFMSVFAKKVIGFSDAMINNFFIISAIFATAGSVFSGFLCDHWGAKRTLGGVYLSWIFALVLALASFRESIFWIVGPLAGMSLGATWVVTRAFAVKIIPEGRMAEFLGVYGITGKFASLFGPLAWGVITWKLEFLGMLRYRIAIAVLICFVAIGLLYLREVEEK